MCKRFPTTVANLKQNYTLRRPHKRKNGLLRDLLSYTDITIILYYDFIFRIFHDFSVVQNCKLIRSRYKRTTIYTFPRNDNI